MTCKLHLFLIAGKAIARCVHALPLYALCKDKISDQMIYDQLADARSDRDKAKVEQIMRDSVEILRHATETNPAEITVHYY